MKVYYLIAMYLSSSGNHIRQDIVKVYKNEQSLNRYIALEELPLDLTPGQFGNYYKKAEIVLPSGSTHLSFILTVNFLGYFGDPWIFQTENEALVRKTLLEAEQLKKDKEYRINSKWRYRKIAVE